MSDVDWVYGAQHMWDNHKVATAEADEAINGWESNPAGQRRYREAQ